ncbi:hypothetical protein Nepgr_007669 [Nepenthes gracilis]|uniref:WEB family protein n=1 Tax=Nepenthes gracilis TaxID=150966 RepID=A0AAD3S7P1_NEPGR|nr:hypothetical protein Nepgr_007669 [Nepenthes gracilis]
MKERPKNTWSPKAGVGEIDTRAPFQSVKDAVNLFGESVFSGERPSIKKAKPHSSERVLAKETQLHLAQKELNKLQVQLNNAETTKAEALAELEKARQAVEDLTKKLEMISSSKEAAIKATEAAKNRAKQLEEANSNNLAVTNGAQKQDLDTAREQYTTVLSVLNAAKQELAKIRQCYDASLEAKAYATKQEAEAELAAKEHTERACEISKEISGVKQTIEQVKQASMRAQEEQERILYEKNIQRESYKSSLDESAKKLQALKKEFDPELAINLEVQLVQTMSEIGTLQNEMKNVKASDIDSVRTITSELDGAKESLQKVLEEESALQSSVESLKLELENLRKEHAELKEKEAETESIAGNLHVKLRKSNSELEACLAEEASARGLSNEMIATLNQLSSEVANTRLEAEDMERKAEQLRKEAEVTRISLDAVEKQLGVALEEAEQAKADEERALEHIKTLSERTDAALSSASDSGAKITISREEFESLSRKVEESDKLAEMKVAAAMAQVEAVKASENEAFKRLEAAQEEVKDTEAATEAALKRAEMAEAAKKAVEGELRRWREREQKKAAEAAARIFAETQPLAPAQASPKPSPVHYHAQKQNLSEKVKKMEKQRASMPKKALLPNLSGIFQRKKSQIEVGSPSYLPGENPI